MGFGRASKQNPALGDAGEMQRTHSKASNKGEPGSPWLGAALEGSGAVLLPTAQDGEGASVPGLLVLVGVKRWP